MNTPIEDRLRDVLRTRADSVEPETMAGDLSGIEPRIAAARRHTMQRRMLLASAAVVLVVGAVVTGFLVGFDDEPDEEIELVTPPTGFDGPNLWPADFIEATFADPVEAAESFWVNYLGLDGCEGLHAQEGANGIVAVEMFCFDVTVAHVFARDAGDGGWVVTGAESAYFEVTSPSPGDTVPRLFDVVVDTNEPDSIQLELRDLGVLETWDTADLIDGNRTFFEVYDDHGSPQVLIVRDQSGSATVFAVNLEEPAGPTSTTVPPVREFELPLPTADDPAIWPPDNATFPDPFAAAQDFVDRYLGVNAECTTDLSEGSAAVVGCGDTEVGVRQEDTGGWLVTAAESNAFDIDEPVNGAMVEVGVPIESTLNHELRRLFELEPLASAAPPEPGDYVFVVLAENTGTVRLVHAEATEPPPPELPACAEGTTTGWPGDALAFANQVLDLPDPVVVEENGVEVTVQSRPSGGPRTTVTVVDGTVRCATSDQGTIDEIQHAASARAVTVSGSATAFEATLTVQLLALDGTVITEQQTMSGSNGEQGPYTATLAYEGTPPAFVLIAEGDASGEGRFVWGTLRQL